MGILDLFKTTPGSATLKRLQQRVDHVNSLETIVSSYSDEDLKNQTFEFKNRLGAGETIDDIADEAFAVVRESAKRVLGMRHYDVQLVGGYVIHEGSIAEMRTGEGKTLVATLAVYLNALSGKGVHLVTVNDYLARRDLAWMGQVYHFLGLTSSVINSGSISYQYDENARVSQDTEIDQERDEEGYFKVTYDYLKPITRQEAYRCDITYGTNSEFGFDYLRDNLVYSLEEKTQRGHSFAIIDEIDSVLIDEARTPLIISASHQDSENHYQTFAHIVSDFKLDEDYLVDEKRRQIQVLEPGVQKAEKLLDIENIYDPEYIKLVHHLESAVRAKGLYLKDREYVVQGDQVVIVDESTGRLMPTRRWSEGLHQAIEAKEGVETKAESRTYASITYQNYFRLYDKLSGMTGTAVTSQEEFFKVYSLEVIVIPTNRPIARIDQGDLIYRNTQAKYRAIGLKLKELHAKGQPVLVGTVSVESNELLSEYLKKENIPHTILNAKNHENEALIVANAGKLGALTIATNMAGRGVDIKLGGEEATEQEYEAVKAAGGLFVLATERHPSRRIDNQLRGRSGRQGDPGETQFYISLDDDLMRIFGPIERIKSLMEKFPEDQPINHKIITRGIENAQERVEGLNFDGRKNVLSYDDVLNTQRKTIYGRRDEIMAMDEQELVERALSCDISEGAKDFINSQLEASPKFAETLRKLYLQVIDRLWVDHLESMDFLRTSVGLKAYGQQEPIVEYKKEGLQQFKLLEQSIDKNTSSILEKMSSQLAEYQAEQQQLQQIQNEANQARENSEKKLDDNDNGSKKPVVKSAEDMIGRNDLITIKKGGEVKTMKFKKVDSFLAEGWSIVGKSNQG